MSGPSLATARARTMRQRTMIAALLTVLLLLVVAEAAIVDLSQAWATGSLYNQNKAYCTIQASVAPCWTRGYVVIQNGEILAEAYTEGNDQNGQYDAWSATKGWSTFFIGVLVDQGRLTITETLADIFNADIDWEGVGQPDQKKTVRVEELLTMTSGLVPAACQPGLNEGQETLQEVLNHVDFQDCQRGQFNYIGQNHILSRIIERRTGQSPRQWAEASGIFTKLGMTSGDFGWTTFGGIEGSGYGLLTNPRIMAKLGQLYLQGGLAATGDQLVASSWVTASVANYIDNTIPNSGPLTGYGYQWYSGGSGNFNGAAAALGGEGQVILFLPSSNITIAIMGQGCMGASSNIMLAETIVNNLGDLSVQQTSCSESFSYWKYFGEHSGQLLWGGLREVSSNLRGRNLD